ncbi:hypothetical protein NC653_015679 [Populus alba x Populus x berolinensis]|uniref:Uncharacterized protein n=1 Tax=Populus alba x Populus x berolinensis TaxID=444605 RepID=A0AAD6VYS8_9ROSI|nr:hypothetical protein NC653_015679 [Populus alba x Populus x berolinensis]
MCCDHRTHLSMIHAGNPLLCIIAWSQQLVGISQTDVTAFYLVLLEKSSDPQLLLRFL